MNKHICALQFTQLYNIWRNGDACVHGIFVVINIPQQGILIQFSSILCNQFYTSAVW